MATHEAPEDKMEKGGTDFVFDKYNNPLEPTHSGTAEDVSNESKDPNIVDWDGPDDPENPLNWSTAKKNVHVVVVSLFTLVA
jgi:hypothetical protein